MLADTGAIASLVSVNVLKRIGKSTEQLKPYNGSLDSVSGHAIRVHRVIDLPIRLGSLEKMLSFVVVDRLHVDAILGTDILTAFRAVMDLEERTMILKETRETLTLGTTRVEESYDASIASTTRLLPGHQALVVSYVRGAVASDSVVLVEGVPGADECLRVARSLCTVHNGQVIVEVLNASAEEIEIREGVLVASDAVNDGKDETSAILSSVADRNVPINATENTELKPALAGTSENVFGTSENDFEVDFSKSSLSTEQRVLFENVLMVFVDMFVETSMRPGRTDLLEFSIDTGTSLPIKPQPYRKVKRWKQR
ncbi:hypothetical protein PHMEG_00039466 [Phytophthora megakarya]|uniref:Peptidase A2 domain-containing protein n=1 Tax=Phytophthora megakarya TaxID=4795 RepID=A0A225UFK9_9STRA|nr:hypothetical protein PHMEG_00039466 [Phytophthora megakarya]